MFEETLHPVETVALAIEGLALLALVLVFLLNDLFIQFQLSMCKLAFVAIVALLLFDPVLAHLCFELALINDSFLSGGVVLLLAGLFLFLP